MLIGMETGGNWSAHCISTWQWITICFVVRAYSIFWLEKKERKNTAEKRELIRSRLEQPVIPLSLHKRQEVACPICNFRQDLR